MTFDADSKRKRDARSHSERLSDILQAFKECKERAIRLNKVNECSITKIALRASVAKAYLTGNKQFSECGIADAYRKIGMEIICFRDQFQQNKGLDHENSEAEILKRELARVKSSVLPIIVELESEKNVTLKWTQEIDKAQKTILLLQAEISDLKSQRENTVVQQFGAVVGIDRAIRTIICPDKYLHENGIYRFDNEEARHKAWLRCYDELDEALSRQHAKRLYVLVGMPCSGKSTWAADAQLHTDRHSVIFDSTNLTRFEREYVAQYAKRATNVKKCCVFFDISIDVINSRNVDRHRSGKVLSVDDLMLLNEKFTQPDPSKESWIDEMIIVRAKDLR